MFGRKLNFATIAGIKIGIDFTWFFIAILLTWSLADGFFPYLYPNLPVSAYWLMGFIGMLGLFVCVVLHELGHSLVAKHYKLPVEQITLFVFGGVSEIKKEPPTPKIEFLMAIAGPAVSVALGVLFYVLFHFGKIGGWYLPAVAILGYLGLINIILAVFNLIPAFPLDGGRVLRSILWAIKKDSAWATRVSTRIGSGFGILMILLGIFGLITGNLIGGIWFIILGFFLQRAALQSRSQFYITHELRGEKVQRFMTKEPIAVAPNVTIKDFVHEYVYASYHQLYPVTQKGNLIGYISLQEVKEIPHEIWGKATVEEAMVPAGTFKTISPDASALEALDMINEFHVPVLLVTKGKTLVGIITAHDLFKMISIKLALEGENPS